MSDPEQHGPHPRWWRLLNHPFLPVAGVIIVITLCIFRQVPLQITSDPSCYLNYGKMASQGRLFFDIPVAPYFYEHGQRFEESAFHGFIKANQGGGLYPYVGAGFALVLAVAIKLVGLAAAMLTNLFLLPLLLFVYAVTLRRVLPSDRPALRRWVPLLAMTVLLFRFQRHLSAWAMIYRELPAMLLAFSALALSAGDDDRTASRLPGRALAAGLLLGLAMLVRETCALLLLPCALLWAWRVPRWASWAGTLRLVIVGTCLSAGLTIGYGPQIAINVVQRGHVVAEQFTASTQHLFNKQEAGRDGEVKNAGFTTANFKRFLPRRLQVLNDHLGAWGFAALLAAFACLGRRYWRFGAVTIVPAVLYTGLYSAFDYPPGNPRYEFMILVFLVPLVALGVGLVFLRDRASRMRMAALSGRILLAALVLGGVVFCVARCMREPRKPQPTVADLDRLRRDLDRFVPAHSAILCEFPARDYLQYLSGGNTMSLNMLLERGLRVETLVSWCANRNVPLFFFDSPNQDLHSVPYSTKDIRRFLAAGADLMPVHTFHLADYRLDGLFGEPDPGLFAVRPLTQTCWTARYDLPSADPCRMLVDLLDWPYPDLPEVVVDGVPFHGLRLTRERLVGVLPAKAGRSVSVSLVASHPLSREIRVSFVAADEPFGLRMGVDGQELDFLGHEWKEGIRVRVGDGYRCLPRQSTLRLEALVPLLGTSADVFMETLPLRGNDVKIDVALNNAATCVNGNGQAVGLLLPACRLGQPILIQNRSQGDVLIRSLLVGHLTNALAVPRPAVGGPTVRCVVALPPESNRTARLLVLQPAPIDDAKPVAPVPSRDTDIAIRTDQGQAIVESTRGWSFLLLDQSFLTLPSASFTVLGSDDLTDSLFLSGFHPAEHEGRWTGASARLLIPPAMLRGGGTITIRCANHRPAQAPPARLTVAWRGNTIAEKTVEDRSSDTLVSVTLPAVSSPSLESEWLELRSPTGRPADWGASVTDMRELGVFVKSVQFEIARSGP